VTYVKRPSGICGNKLDVDGLPSESVTVAVSLPLLKDRGHKLSRGTGLEGDVDKARSCHFRLGYAFKGCHISGKSKRKISGWHTRRFCDFQRDRSGPIAVFCGTRPLQSNIDACGRILCSVSVKLLLHTLGNQGCKRLGVHNARVYPCVLGGSRL
jgi:hypothetical protein